VRAVNLENPITLLLIIGFAIAGIGALNVLERQMGRSVWIDNATGILGFVIFAALVLLAGVYLAPQQTPWSYSDN
jgi:hypothetical protein